MASGTQLAVEPESVRMTLCGDPGSGKSGALAALLNAGFKVRMIDLEGNYDPLLRFTDPRALANLDVVTLQAKTSVMNGAVRIDPQYKVYNEALKLMQEWKYTNPDGSVTSLGKPDEWGPDTVLVLDSGTRFAEAAFTRALQMNNISEGKRIPISIYGDARTDYDKAIDLMKRKTRRYHLVVLVHLRLYGPEDYLKMDEKDTFKKEGDDGLGAIGAEKLEAIAADLIPTKLVPIGVSKDHGATLGSSLPTMVRAIQKVVHNRTVRVLQTETTQPVDLKFPVPGVKAEYPIETGLASLFEALGFKGPGFG